MLECLKGKGPKKWQENLGSTFIQFFKLGFTPCKAEQPLQGKELQEKKHKKNKAQEMLRKNLQLKDVC